MPQDKTSDLSSNYGYVTAFVDAYNSLNRRSNTTSNTTGGRGVNVNHIDECGVAISLSGSQRNLNVLVKITGVAGGGKYKARIFAPKCVAPTGNLGATDLGTDPGTDNAIAINPAEVGSSTNAIAIGSYIPGVVIGLSIETTPKMLVMISQSTRASAIITAVTAINGGIRWRYTIHFGHWDMTTSASTGGTWVDDSGGAAVTAFSAAEDMNTFTSGTGTIGTGNTDVAQTDGTVNGGSCKLVPLPVGDYVVVIPRGTDTTSMLTYYTIIGMPNSAQ